MPHKKLELPFFEKVKQFFNNKCVIKKGFTLAEGLIGLAIVAVIVVLLLPVVTTRAQNKSFAVTYETELKQMLNSLEGLPINENKDDIKQTMMYIENDTGNYSNNAGAYINKYMKVSKYCGDTPGDCFGSEYYEYKDNDKENEKIDLKKQLSDLSDEQLRIVTAIDRDGSHIDDIIQSTGMGAGKVLSQLTILEIKGYIKRAPGRRVTLNIR